MALMTTQQVQITGPAITYGAVTSADTVVPDERTWLEVINGSGGSITVTIVVPGTSYGQNNPDVAVTVPVSTTPRKIGPLVRGLANSSGFVDVQYSATTSITAAAVRI